MSNPETALAAGRRPDNVDNRGVSVDHYENFPVASILCPPHLRPAVTAIYHFARTADDIADEGDAPAGQRLAKLSSYRADLHAACRGEAVSARWPQVFGPLQPVIAAHALPESLLADLLGAFEQDVVKTRYADRAELLDYCRRSANPVGRLLLHLYGVTDASALSQSDAICTALQLANFWQDLGVDTRRGRIYPPASDCARHGVGPDALLAQLDGPNVRALVAELVGWARGLMQSGAPLVHTVPGRAGWELRLVVQGGLRILEKIEAMNFGTLQARPTLGAADAPRLLWRALWMRAPRAIVASRSA
jgi:squalene synthase HpnC